MLPQIAEIILIKKPLIDAETKLRKKPFPGVGRERGAAHPAHAVLLATNHETVEVKVAPIECDLEQVVQHCDAAVAGHVQTPPYRRVDLDEQDVELANLGRSVWLDHSRPRSLVVALFSPRFFPVTASSSPSGNCRPQVASHRPQSGVGLGLAPHACPGKEALAQVAD